MRTFFFLDFIYFCQNFTVRRRQNSQLFTPQMAEVSSQALYLGLPTAWQGTNFLSHVLPLLPRPLVGRMLLLLWVVALAAPLQCQPWDGGWKVAQACKTLEHFWMRKSLSFIHLLLLHICPVMSTHSFPPLHCGCFQLWDGSLHLTNP